jgi:DNA-binding response OmpR family regulator
MSEPFRTLVVEDEDGARLFFEEALRLAGYDVASVSSGEEALNRLRDTSFDLILLDLKLGGRVDGLRVLQAVRWRWPDTAVVILTAHGSLESAMAAIREGVGGYLLKPVEPAELRKAVGEALERRKALRQLRQEVQEADILRYGPFVVDRRKHTGMVADQPLDLTPQEFALLAHLIENSDRTVSPKELVTAVRHFEPEHMYEAREIIKWYIHRLRRKVEPDPANPRYILNVRGVGYRLGQ